MTNHQQQAEALFEKYVVEKGYSPSDIGAKDMIAFAAFCLERQSQQTGLKDANGKTINYGDTIESIDSEGKAVRHTIERDLETGLPIARYGPHSTCSVYQQWINKFKKVIVNP